MPMYYIILIIFNKNVIFIASHAQVKQTKIVLHVLMVWKKLMKGIIKLLANAKMDIMKTNKEYVLYHAKLVIIRMITDFANFV